jgi:hypothetical protein
MLGADHQPKCPRQRSLQVIRNSCHFTECDTPTIRSFQAAVRTLTTQSVKPSDLTQGACGIENVLRHKATYSSGFNGRNEQSQVISLLLVSDD